MRKPIGVSASSMQWAMSPAVRARIGAARMRPGGNVGVAERRRDGHRHVHRQRLAPDLSRRFRERKGRLDRAAGDSTLARERDHALGARIDGLVQRMAIAGERLAPRAIFARDLEGGCVERAACVDARQHILDHLPAEVGRAQNDRAAAEHAGGDGGLKRRGIGVVGHARRLDRWRQPMLGERHQAEIEKEALLFGRRPAGRKQEDIVGEADAAHEIIDEIEAAHRDPVARRGGDRGSGGPRLADQHGVPFPSDPFAFRVRRMGVGRL